MLGFCGDRIKMADTDDGRGKSYVFGGSGFGLLFCCKILVLKARKIFLFYSWYFIYVIAFLEQESK